MLSFYSGTQIYDVYLYNSFNIFFTGMPICWFCTYDWQYSKKQLLSDPRLYEIGLNDSCFNPRLFWTWYVFAIVEGALLLFLSFYTLDEAYEEALDYKTDEKDGGAEVISGSLSLNGVFIFQAIVVLVNIKLFI